MARLLLDTHALIWLLDGSPRLGPKARHQIDSAQDAAVSVASLWEIAIKTSLGRLPAVPDLEATISSGGLRRLGIEPAHLAALTKLSWRKDHRDPFDRMLVAQAKAEGLALVTADPHLKGYGARLIAATT